MATPLRGREGKGREGGERRRREREREKWREEGKSKGRREGRREGKRRDTLLSEVMLADLCEGLLCVVLEEQGIDVQMVCECEVGMVVGVGVIGFQRRKLLDFQSGRRERTGQLCLPPILPLLHVITSGTSDRKQGRGEGGCEGEGNK